jgi:hypothetical protein
MRQRVVLRSLLDNRDRLQLLEQPKAIKVVVFGYASF